jgi:hypothetical protein
LKHRVAVESSSVRSTAFAVGNDAPACRLDDADDDADARADDAAADPLGQDLPDLVARGDLPRIRRGSGLLTGARRGEAQKEEGERHAQGSGVRSGPVRRAAGSITHIGIPFRTLCRVRAEARVSIYGDSRETAQSFRLGKGSTVHADSPGSVQESCAAST